MQLTFLLYPGVEPIDLAVLGVVSMARRVIPDLSYRTVARDTSAVELSNGLLVVPQLSFDEAGSVDVLVVPGGPGWRAASEDAQTLAFIRRMASGVTVCSVCTGAMILAAAGTLDGLSATTKREVVPPETSPLLELQQRYPDVRTRSALIVDNGSVITGGGVSLCIDATLYLIERRYGAQAVAEVERILEYGAARSANRARFAELG